MSNPIVVVEPDPKWAETFAWIRRQLQASIVGVPVIAIEHVGSTAVPGLAAKPIIDVDIVVAPPDVDGAVEALESIGYVSLGDLGVPDRIAFRAPDEAPRRNVYVTVEGCLSLRNHLGVREVLRTDPQLRDEYSAVKRRLAEQTGDIEVYVAGKTEIVRLILERAGLNSSELDEIEGINRR
jgi:GrpB-like predicted nucleotidyltransferase (UPF0157 family)